MMDEAPGIVINIDTLAYGRDLQIIAAIRELLEGEDDSMSVAILSYVASDLGLRVVPKE